MTRFSHFLRGLSSYNANVLMAALISLLLLVLFILLLHIYAKWFLAHSRTRRRRSTTSAFPTDHHRFNIHFQSFPLESSSDLGTLKGLDPAAISSIPLFVYTAAKKAPGGSSNKEGDVDGEYSCVICLSQFEENEGGRRLRKCGHCFHVDCLDMWLHSHSNCPICRAPAVSFSETNYNINIQADVNDDGAAGDDQNGVPSEGDHATVVLQVHEIHHHSSSHPVDDNSTTITSASSSSSCIGYCSLKRMLSRNRSEGKIFPSNYEDAGQILQISQL